MAADDRVELVRRAYEAWNAHGPRALAPFVADTVELHDAPELPDATTWRGDEAVLARLEEVARTVGSGSGEIEGFRRHRDCVVVELAWQLEDDDPGEASLGRVFHVVRVRAGRIIRIRVFLDEAAAVRAAGLPA